MTRWSWVWIPVPHTWCINFSLLSPVKIVLMFEKTENKWKKRPGMALFNKMPDVSQNSLIYTIKDHCTYSWSPVWLNLWFMTSAPSLKFHLLASLFENIFDILVFLRRQNSIDRSPCQISNVVVVGRSWSLSLRMKKIWNWQDLEESTPCPGMKAGKSVIIFPV